jgi:hypothetical protein
MKTVFKSQLADLITDFNLIFTKPQIVNLKLRQSCLLAIVHLHQLEQRVAQQEDINIRRKTAPELAQKIKLLKQFMTQQKEVMFKNHNAA